MLWGVVVFLWICKLLWVEKDNWNYLLTQSFRPDKVQIVSMRSSGRQELYQQINTWNEITEKVIDSFQRTADEQKST